ncbi:lipocalin-like domain-containing protein [Streptacidiphilus sp. P02-A3a]|uniref:lipocalin-like domain-containing protein n=1 Tax=Streptacidiphilus sp. P02-A3a TaxID=2704468 RepID=UPI0015FD398E|nr:lipocalin-like domain-containing protein [Streptacidiphilus sp. P02-A3a]QMU67362.1 lipocalin-like domain-containing protein [Streptacidiphilus sp. P02-A3a]
MLSEKDLVGVWRLVSHFYVDSDGSTSEGPLGDKADGLLIYHRNGYMTASMMRTVPLTTEDCAAPQTYLGSADDFLGYAGRWRLAHNVVVHQVSIGSHARVVNTRQFRHAEMIQDTLRLRRRLGGPHALVVMDWQRVAEATTVEPVDRGLLYA